ncbi:Ig domain-containing protein [Pedosphaera parvula]|uniref:Ig family protein n=1 Tax=Pedosphaera parvula (strain Ellin514) TaxID=320771 RepID=B9XF03_PEDPL|nr:Ig domain-containing protein [Pedosphaera parvula]EEF61501.1 Ig family protein [Pedosphaera parvula Ellin514]
MLQMIKRFYWVMVFAAVTQVASAFSLIGPYEAYQVDTIGYHLPGDIGAPKNLLSEYRWNTPTIYYAYDEAFTGFFRSNGTFAVDQAFSLLNNLKNLSSYSPELSEFSLNTSRYNYEAQALALIDLKSVALSVIVEELGLTDPERWVWTLRGRVTQPGASCPFMIYTTEMRNYDPLSNAYSPYVNGTLWSYLIIENCGVGGPPSAISLTFPVDPTAPNGTPVVSLVNGRSTSGFGLFFNGLSRDDVGGLRYLMGTNNYNVETVETNSLQFVTNRFSQLLVTTNLTTLIAQSLTNDPVSLTALFPGLIIDSFTNFFVNVITTNFTATFVNKPFVPAFTPASLVLTTNFTTNAAVRFIYKFANVVTNTYFTKGFVTITDTSVTNGGSWTPTGASLVTNVTTRTVITNIANGTFYLIPSNTCGVQIINTQLVSLVTFTNTIAGITNVAGVTNIDGQNFRRDIITYNTNFSLIVYPILCVTNSVDKREGIDHIKFVRVDLDPISGRIKNGPITNIYHLVSVNQTNPQPTIQTFIRVLNFPDWLFSGIEDPSPLGDAAVYREFPRFTPVPNFGTNAGPGILQGPVDFLFNINGPLIVNFYSTNFFLNGLPQAQGQTNFVWGSFDSSTNAPIVYPESYTITNIDNLLFFYVITTAPPDGRVGVSYSTQLDTAGGQAPFLWSLNASSAGLPDGLTLSPDGVISGTPTTEGIYDFTVDVTESGGRTTTQDLSINITP